MKIVCVGRNYAAHIEELQNEKPKHPVLFLKPDTTILQKKQPFFIPHFSNDIHYEVEVLVKIQRLGKHIQPEFAHKYYSQIGLGIDFTARSVQNELKEKGWAGLYDSYMRGFEARLAHVCLTTVVVKTGSGFVYDALFGEKK